MSTIQEIRAAYKSLALAIPLQKRRILRSKIAEVSQHLGVKEDLVEDRRTLTWAENSDVRKAIAKRFVYNLSIRGGTSWTVDTLDLAAKHMNLKSTTLRTYLSQPSGAGLHRHVVEFNDQIITVTKLHGTTKIHDVQKEPSELP
jgi:hypothetical protein